MKNNVFFLPFLLIALSTAALGVTVSPEIEFHVGNQIYMANHTMDFENITIDSSYIIFNSTGFCVTSANSVNITLIYINGNATGAGDGEKVLEFNATADSGNVRFDISGFPGGTNYTVNRSGTHVADGTANISGFISFNNSEWSEENFEVFQSGDVATTSTTTTTVSGGGSSGGTPPTTTVSTTTTEQDNKTGSSFSTAESTTSVRETEEKKEGLGKFPEPEEITGETETHVLLSMLVFGFFICAVAVLKRREIFG